MSLVAVETDFGSLTTAVYPGSYLSTSLNLGPTMGQFAEAGNEGKFVGPIPVAFTRPDESAVVAVATVPYVVSWSTNIDWVFLAENVATASPRKIFMYTFNKTTHAFTLQGGVSMAFPSAATNYTNVTLIATYDKYSVGTAACDGTNTTVTGASTPNWQTARLAAGSRIAFGTTDPTTNPTWYEISSIGSETGIVLTTTGPNTGGQGSYVIEELRLVLVTTNNTTTSGGVFIAKGLRPEIFTSGVTAIAASASTADNLRLVYWLADAATVTNITSKGAAAQTRTDWQTHYLWVFEGLASPNEILFKYNLRALMTLTSGKNVTPFESFVYKTGIGGAFTGAPSAINNMRLATMASGPGSGANCLYFTTVSRIYRTIAVGSILTGSTTWLSGGDVMTEVPPGGVSIGFGAVTGALNSLDYIAAIDKWIIWTTSATAFKSYITGYNATGSQMDRIFSDDFRQVPQVSSDSIGLAPMFNTQSTSGIQSFTLNGLSYIVVPGATINNFIYVLPLGADWEYTAASNNVIITPSMATPNCASLYRAVCNEVAIIGGRTGQNLGATTEPYRISYRTTGISDNTGSWNLLDYTGDLSGVGPVTAIQFKLEFRTIGHTNLPARITNLICLYNDTATDTHFQASVALSSTASTIFAWRFSTLFGGTPPTLYVRLYDATNPSTLYLTDNSASPTGGVWMYSTNSGGGWSAFPLADKGNETTYIKYTPTSFGSGIKVRAVLSLS